MVADELKIGLLTLPNEILDQIFVECFHPSQLSSPRARGKRGLGPMAWETCFRALRLVNNHLALVGKRYLAFKFLITSERQLQVPDEEAQLYMRFTRELTIQKIPIFHYLSQLHDIYPNITHLTLSNIRLKPVNGGEELVFLPSVRYLWLEVTNAICTYIPKLLESFPALRHLALHSDARSPPMVNTTYLLSFPALPKLVTLHRPPRPQSAFNLSTRIYFNSGPEMDHRHLVLPCYTPPVIGASAPDPTLPYFYAEDCVLCQQWNTRASDSEAREIVELTRHFPSLRRVLIQRVLCLDGVSVNDDPQIYAPDTGLGTEERERTSCAEEWAERRDVAIWCVQRDWTRPTHKHEEGERQGVTVSQKAAETKFWSNTQSALSTSDNGRFCFDWDL